MYKQGIKKVDFDDYYGYVAESMCKAAATFDESRNYKFSTYAYCVMDNDLKLLKRDSYTQKRKANHYTCSYEQIIEDNKYTDILKDNNNFEEYMISLLSFQEIMNTLNNKERLILQKMIDGKTQKEIAFDEGVTYQYISAVLKRAKAKIVREMMCM